MTFQVTFNSAYKGDPPEAHEWPPHEDCTCGSGYLEVDGVRRVFHREGCYFYEKGITDSYSR